MDVPGKLLLFHDVVRLGGFSHAARERGLSHSTVSKHIRVLEERLGVQLLRRTSRAMSLTEEGQLVYDLSRRIGAAFDELFDRLDRRRGEISGTLRVNSLLHVGRHLVQPAVAALVRAHPGLRVALTLDDGPLAFHRDGYDVAVRVGLPEEGSLTARKLCDNDVCLAATEELLTRAGRLRHPAELADYPTVAYAAGSIEITRWPYIDAGDVKTVEVSPVCVVDNGNALLDAVYSGLGVGYVSSFAVRRDLDEGRLLRVLPDFRLPPYEPVYVLHASRGYASPKVEAFKRELFVVAEAMA